MLKLLKYELIHEWRSYGIIYLVFIAACGLSPILFKDQIMMNQAMVQTDSTMNMLGMISILVISILTMAIIISTAAIRRRTDAAKSRFLFIPHTPFCLCFRPLSLQPHRGGWRP